MRSGELDVGAAIRVGHPIGIVAGAVVLWAGSRVVRMEVDGGLQRRRGVVWPRMITATSPSSAAAG